MLEELLFLKQLFEAVSPLLDHPRPCMGIAASQIVATVFLAAGIYKIFRRAVFLKLLEKYGFCRMNVSILSRIPEIECAIGLATMVGGPLLPGISVATIALIVAFTMFQFYVLRHKTLTKTCPCFGQGKISRHSILRNTVLLGLVILAVTNVPSQDQVHKGVEIAIRATITLLMIYGIAKVNAHRPIDA